VERAALKSDFPKRMNYALFIRMEDVERSVLKLTPKDEGFFKQVGVKLETNPGRIGKL
jgi:hypothetical protein